MVRYPSKGRKQVKIKIKKQLNYIKEIPFEGNQKLI